jgi:hypothetical protein
VRRFLATCYALLLLVLTASNSVPPQPVWAQAGDSQPELVWEQSGLSEAVQELFTPSSGAFLATTTSGLMRSDDAGATWRSVSLPPPGPGQAARAIAVDPTNHDSVYASGADGVYLSTDGGATWKLRLSAGQVEPTLAPDRFRWHIAVSPADHNVVYVGVTWVYPTNQGLRLLLSQDAGATWREVRRTSPPYLCGWGLFLLVPHPSDPQRVSTSLTCVAGREFGASVEHSLDQGAVWSQWFNQFAPAGEPVVSAGFPTRLVGGRGAAPGRFYLAVNRDVRLGGSSVFRTDDDGASWGEVLAFRGGGSPGYAGSDNDPDAALVSLPALAYDPADPDRVFVGADVALGRTCCDQPVPAAGVKFSPDGGASWQDLGQDIGAVHDLALGIDGRNLYAATDAGVWRLGLDQAQAPAGAAPQPDQMPDDGPPE